MTGKRPRPPGCSKLTTAPDYQKSCQRCGTTEFDYSTNGDGSSVQLCKACGHLHTLGRYYQDKAVGFRLINFSVLSALVTSTPKGE